MESTSQNDKNEQNPLLNPATLPRPAFPGRRVMSSDRLPDIRNTSRNSSLPDSQIGLKKNEGLLLNQQPEDPRLLASHLAQRYSGSKLKLGQHQFGDRSRVNTGPEYTPSHRRNTDDQNFKSPLFNGGQRSILELQQSIIDPRFRRMTSRVLSQAKIQTFKQVSSQRFHPEMLLYKVKKITMARKFDPEIGKIKLRIDKFGNQEMNKFPKRPETPLRKNVVDYPSSVSSNKTFSKNFGNNDLSSLANKSAKQEFKTLNPPLRADNGLTLQNLLSPDQVDQGPKDKFDFDPEENLAQRVQLHENVEEDVTEAKQFGIKPIPVLQLKPRLNLPTPLMSNRRTSFSQNRKLHQPIIPASVEKEEVLLATKPQTGLAPVEDRLNYFRTKLRTSQKSMPAEKSTIDKRSGISMPKNDLTKADEKNATETTKLGLKALAEEKSIMIDEENETPLPSAISDNEFRRQNMGLKQISDQVAQINELMVDQSPPDADILVSKMDKNDHGQPFIQEINEIDQLLQKEKSNRSDENHSSDNGGDQDNDEEQDVVPKIDFLKNLKGKNDQFSTIHETDEENRSISSKFGTELHFGTKGPHFGDRLKPSNIKNLNETIDNDKRPSQTKNSEKDNSISGFEFSTKNVGDSLKKYGTDKGNGISDTPDAKVRRTMNPLTTRNPEIPPRYSHGVESKKEAPNFSKAANELAPIEINTSSEKPDNDQSYFDNFDQDEPQRESPPIPKINVNTIPNKDSNIGHKKNELKGEQQTTNSEIPKIKISLKESNQNVSEELDAYLDDIHKLRPSELIESNTIKKGKPELNKSADVSWQFSDHTQNDPANPKSQLSILTNNQQESVIETDPMNRNFTFQKPNDHMDKIDGASLAPMQDSKSEQLISINNQEEVSDLLLSRTEPVEDSTQNGIDTGKETPPSIVAPHEDQHLILANESIQKVHAGIHVEPAYVSRFHLPKEATKVIQASLVIEPLELMTIDFFSEQNSHHVKIPGVEPMSVTNVNLQSDGLKANVSIPAIDPLDIAIVTLPSEKLADAPQLLFTQPIEITNILLPSHSIKSLAKEAPLDPAMIIGIQSPRESLNQKVSMPHAQPANLTFVHNQSQVVKKKVSGTTSMPITKTFILLQAEILKQPEPVKEPRTNLPETKDTNPTPNIKGITIAKIINDEDTHLAVPPSSRTDEQVKSEVSEEPQVLPTQVNDFNTDFKKFDSRPSSFKPKSDKNNTIPKNPSGSQRGVRVSALKGGILQKRPDANNATFGSIRVDKDSSPTHSKLSISSVVSKIKGPKENLESDRSNNLEADRSSKRVGWSINDGTVAQRNQKKPQKGERIRIDDLEPAFSENTKPNRPKDSQKVIKAKLDSENSALYESFSENFAKKSNQTERDDMTSLANISLIDLDDDKIKMLSDRKNDAMSFYVNNLKGRKKLSRAKTLGGVCCLFFFVSSILWIILLKILSDKNAFLSSIILYPPTLSLYHQVYTDFFLNYDRNVELYRDSQRTLDQELFPKYHEHSAALKDVTSLKIDNSLSMLTIKKYLADRVNSIPSQKKKLAPPESRELIVTPRKVPKPYTHSNNHLPSNEVNKIIRRLEVIKDKITRHEHNRADMKMYLEDIQTKAQGLYERSFELIDNYGRFFLMTNRIWITTENIYQYYKNKANEIIEEMRMLHYKIYSEKRKQMKLLFLHYKSWAKIMEFPALEITSDRRSLLLCTIKAEVINPELNQLGRSFDFFLSLNNEYNLHRKSFEYKISNEHTAILIPQVLEIQPGINKIELYGVVTGDQIVFSKLYVNCVNLIEYKRISDHVK